MDLFALVADKNIEYALRGALSRHRSLGIREISFDIRVHSGRDGGARTTGPDLLTVSRGNASVALLVFDFEGSGVNVGDALSLEQQMDARLVAKAGLNSKTIVINPECDIWMWASNNALANAIGWDKSVSIRAWAQRIGFQFDGNGKPNRPKEALEAVLHEQRMPRSSALYQDIASRVSLRRCVDPAYLRLRSFLQSQFS
jgi:hypothetical protein